MKCPNCKAVMDREDHYDGFHGGKGVPAAAYVCLECDTEIWWTKGYPLRVVWTPERDKISWSDDSEIY